MKPKKIIYLEKILRLMAKSVIWKYKPTIVGVTGSVGKTSAKEAIFLVLSSKFNVRKNEKNYNNEIGLPLTIIGAESGNRSFLKWGKVFLKWIGEMILPFHYPKILVLEMGVDRPGDMDYLLSFIKPTVGVMTNVSGSHLEFFKNIEQIAKEKSKLLKEIPEDGLAILNSDNEYIFETSKKLKIPFLFFGFGEKAKVRASFLGYVFEDFEPQGMSFKLSYQGKTVPIRLPGILAPHLVYASLAAVATGIFFKINLVEISGALEKFVLPPGRMNLLRGANKSFIIDDSYNSSPTSAMAAMEVLRDIKAVRKIVALGDMLELGENSKESHKEVLKTAWSNGTTLFFVSGDRIKQAARELEIKGQLPGKIFYFDDPVYLGSEMRKILRAGDLVLVKGSQGSRMEMAAEQIIEFPENAEKILCRQSKDWRKKAYVKP